MLVKKGLKINYKILIISIILGTAITFFTYNINRKVIKNGEKSGKIIVGTTYIIEMGWPLPYYQEQILESIFIHNPRLAMNRPFNELGKLAMIPPKPKDNNKTPIECIFDIECVQKSAPNINLLNLFVDIIFFSVISYIILSLATKYLK